MRNRTLPQPRISRPRSKESPFSSRFYSIAAGAASSGAPHRPGSASPEGLHTYTRSKRQKRTRTRTHSEGQGQGQGGREGGREGGRDTTHTDTGVIQTQSQRVSRGSPSTSARQRLMHRLMQRYARDGARSSSANQGCRRAPTHSLPRPAHQPAPRVQTEGQQARQHAAVLGGKGLTTYCMSG